MSERVDATTTVGLMSISRCHFVYTAGRAHIVRGDATRPLCGTRLSDWTRAASRVYARDVCPDCLVVFETR